MTISLMNIKCKNSKQNISKPNNTEEDVHRDQVWFT